MGCLHGISCVPHIRPAGWCYKSLTPFWSIRLRSGTKLVALLLSSYWDGAFTGCPESHREALGSFIWDVALCQEHDGIHVCISPLCGKVARATLLREAVLTECCAVVTVSMSGPMLFSISDIVPNICYTFDSSSWLNKATRPLETYTSMSPGGLKTKNAILVQIKIAALVLLCSHHHVTMQVTPKWKETLMSSCVPSVVLPFIVHLLFTLELQVLLF